MSEEKKKEKLKELIEQAKRENRDAESLERELKNLEQEQQMTKEMQELAQSLKGARQALEMKDFDGLADKLGDVSKQLEGIQDELQDLEDIEEHLQNLKQMKKEGCKECEGAKKDGEGPGGDKDGGGGRAEGRLVGGSLTLLAASLGTPWEVDTRGALLVFEEIGEKPYALDRDLMHLGAAGKLDTALGFGVGSLLAARTRSAPRPRPTTW